MKKFDGDLLKYIELNVTKSQAWRKSDVVRMHYNGKWYDEVYTRLGCELVQCPEIEKCDHRNALKKRSRLICPCVNIGFKKSR